MLLALLFVAIFFWGLVFIRWFNEFDLRGILAIFLIVIGIFGSLICGIIAMVVSCNKDVEFEKALYEKKTIEYRIENKNKNIVGNELLYADIVEFNNKLRSAKKWSNNIWVNWFNNDKIAKLDYIEFEFGKD